MNNYTKLAFHLVGAANIKKASMESGAPQDGEKGIDWGWGLGGLAGIPALARGGYTAFGMPLEKKLENDVSNFGNETVRNLLNSSGKPLRGFLTKQRHRNLLLAEHGRHFLGGSPEFNQGAFGHLIGAPLAIGGLGGALFTSNEDTARRNALIGSGTSTAAYLPYNIARGMRKLDAIKHLGGGAGVALKSLSHTLPTLAISSLPLMGYGIKKFYGGYDKAQPV